MASASRLAIAAFTDLEGFIKAEKECPTVDIRQHPLGVPFAALRRHLETGGDLAVDTNDLLRDRANSGSLASSSGGRRGSHGPNGSQDAGKPVSGGKRGPKRTMPRLDDLQAELAAVQDQLSMLEQENLQLRKRKELLETIIRCKEERVQRLAVVAEESADGSRFLAEAHAKLASEGVVLPHTPTSWADYATMSPEQMLDNHKALLQALADALLCLESSGSSPQELQRMADRVKSISVVMQEVLQGLMVCKADLAHLPRLFLDGRGEGPGEQHWVAAVQAIGMSEEQLVSCTILYGLCTKWVSRVRATRMELVREHAALAEAVKAHHTDLASRDLLRCVEALQANVRHEFAVLMLVAEVLLTRILGPTQYAKCYVASHPFIVDVIAFLMAAARVYVGRLVARGVV